MWVRNQRAAKWGSTGSKTLIKLLPRGFASKLTHVVVGRPSFLTNCWLKTSVLPGQPFHRLLECPHNMLAASSSCPRVIQNRELRQKSVFYNLHSVLKPNSLLKSNHRSEVPSLLPYSIYHTYQPCVKRLYKGVNPRRWGSLGVIWKTGYHRNELYNIQTSLELEQEDYEVANLSFY